MSRFSVSSPGQRPGSVPYLTLVPSPRDDPKPAKWDEEKLLALFSSLSKEEFLRAWNAGLALASLDLAVQAGVIPLSSLPATAHLPADPEKED